MRVGFTGSQGSGKTTVMRRIEKSKAGFTIVPSTARAALEAGYKVNRDADPLSQLITTCGRIAIEDKLYRETSRTVSDRTPLDSLAYTTYQWSNEWPRYEKNKYYWNLSHDLVFEHMAKYDAIFYFPPYWAPKGDGVRDEDVDYQETIDTTIKMYLGTWNITFSTMPNSNTEERFKFFCNELSHLTNPVT